MAFIDAHHEDLGIEPICRELAIAPSSYHEHAARFADPGKRSARARRDDEIKQQIRRIHAASFGLYGTRKVWHQLRREGIKVAKCTVERLMQAMGLAGVRRGKKTITTVSNPKAPCPLDKVNRKSRVTSQRKSTTSTIIVSIRLSLHSLLRTAAGPNHTKIDGMPQCVGTTQSTASFSTEN